MTTTQLGRRLGRVEHTTTRLVLNQSRLALTAFGSFIASLFSPRAVWPADTYGANPHFWTTQLAFVPRRDGQNGYKS